MTNSERMSARYARLKSQHRCVRCAKRLPKQHTSVRCDGCNGDQDKWSEAHRRAHGAKPWDKGEFQRQVDVVVATSETHGIAKQAALLGVGVERVYVLRAAARRQGAQISREHAKTGGYYGPASRKWAELDAVMTTACPKCGLRGAHECARGNAEDRRPW